ncbi:MAG: HIT domain-containing protein [Flavobacteriaceae bacterium]|nr:HIT domain-containing protein [Flavobacteriaceae bacterium]
MDSIFTKIIKGEIPSYKISENENFIAILDAFPNVAGHVLVIPKKQVNKLFDLDKNLYTELFEYSRTIAKAIEKAIDCKRVGLTVIGLEVPHVHVHLLPLNTEKDMVFMNKDGVNLSKEEFINIAEKIKSFL